MPAEYIEVEAEVIKTTDGACLVSLINHDDEEVWIPWSCIERNEEPLTKGYVGRIYVLDWFAQKHDIAY